MKKSIGSTLSVLAFALLFSMASVMACSCIAPRDVQTELNESYAVFQGKVVDVDQSMLNYEYTVRLDVEKSWKGIMEDSVEVRTALDSAACGFPFQLNETYLIYAVEFEGDVWVYSCGRTALLEDAQADIAELGDPIFQPDASEPEKETSFFMKIRLWLSRLFN